MASQSARGGQAYLFARVTREGSVFYPQIHPLVEARLERGLKALWDALEELAGILGGGPVGFTVETGGAIISGYWWPEGVTVVASPKKWRAHDVEAGGEGVVSAVGET